MKYLNISGNEEMDHILKCLSEDMILEENILSQEDIKKLCAEINFEENIPETFPSTTESPSTTETTSTTTTPLSLSDITLGDELNLSNIFENEILSSHLPDLIIDNVDFNVQTLDNDTLTTPTFDVQFNLDEILEAEMSTQEVSTAVKQLEKVSVMNFK